ncbi:hypothetical protein GCM10009596_25940 [Arthrobacter rhombi]|uniref:hypothetical protein n=1 Tax=Arthrobacter rhombi TaxID=71253 RepID=UPI0031CFD4EB
MDDTNRQKARGINQAINMGLFDDWHQPCRTREGQPVWRLVIAFVFALGEDEPELIDSRAINIENDEIEIVAMNARHVFRFAGVLDPNVFTVEVHSRNTIVGIEVLEAPESIESSSFTNRHLITRLKLTLAAGDQFTLPLSPDSNSDATESARRLYPALLKDLSA